MTWGHAVFHATPTTDWQTRCTMPARGFGLQAGKCNQPTGYVARHYYVTGRQGRTSSSDRWVCEEHAQRFATKHQIAILEEGPRGRSTDATRMKEAKL